LAPVVLALLYNHLRTGNPLGNSYSEGVDELGFSTPIYEGLYGLFLSPGKGLIWYGPIALVGAVAWWRRRSEPAAWLVAGLSASYVGVVACWWAWHGAECWGPRLIVPLLPLWVLPAGALLTEGQTWRRVAVVAAVIGLAVQLVGAAVAWQHFYHRAPYTTWAEGMQQGTTTIDPHNLDSVHYSVSQSPIVGHAWLAGHLAKNSRDLSGTAPWSGTIRNPSVDFGFNWWPLAAQGRGAMAHFFAWPLLAALLLGAGVWIRKGWREAMSSPTE
jgi:hypothetical protein